jgi:hypothetical protein
MRTERTGPAAFLVEFADEDELAAEERAHLAFGGLVVACDEPLAPRTPVALLLRVAGGGEASVAAQVVAPMAGGLALHLEGNPAEILEALRTEPESEDDEATRTSLWERLRDMTPPQKILLAPKADRVTRALLVQESDPQILFALLKNPRLSIDEVVRVAKSSFLSFQATELILKTNPWFSNLDVRLALVHNPRTPLPFALRILQTLPDREVRLIAKGAATSMALKQAALRKVQGG